MRKTNLILLAMAAVAIAMPAEARRGRGSDDGPDHRSSHGNDFCTNAPRSEWKSMSLASDKATSMGYAVTKVEISGTCYEVYGRKNGTLYELYFNPVTGELVKVERR